MAKDLKRDMESLAKRVYNLSKKYGGMYINAACCRDATHSWATYSPKGSDELKDANYYAETNTFWHD
jgi:hypothetical protein